MTKRDKHWGAEEFKRRVDEAHDKAQALRAAQAARALELLGGLKDSRAVCPCCVGKGTIGIAENAVDDQ